MQQQQQQKKRMLQRRREYVSGIIQCADVHSQIRVGGGAQEGVEAKWHTRIALHWVGQVQRGTLSLLLCSSGVYCRPVCCWCSGSGGEEEERLL